MVQQFPVAAKRRACGKLAAVSATLDITGPAARA